MSIIKVENRKVLLKHLYTTKTAAGVPCTCTSSWSCVHKHPLLFAPAFINCNW